MKETRTPANSGEPSYFPMDQSGLKLERHDDLHRRQVPPEIYIWAGPWAGPPNWPAQVPKPILKPNLILLVLLGAQAQGLAGLAGPRGSGPAAGMGRARPRALGALGALGPSL